MKKIVVKILTVLFVITGFAGCKSAGTKNANKWDEKFTIGVGYKTLDEVINEFGKPIKIIDNSNYNNDSALQWFEDRLTPTRNIDETVTFISEWNKKSGETIIQQTIPMEISEFKNSNEFQWLETNYPITRYQETIGDRKKREALINQKIDFPLVWNSDVYNNKLSDYLMNNEYNQVGLKMVYETIKPEFKKIYEFDLGKGKYGEYYSDKKEQEFPEDLELTFTGILYIDWDGNLKSGDLDWTYENPVTLCDCMTKGNDYSTPGTFTFRFCEARFLEFFGTKSPDIKNYWVKKKYDECMYKKN